jgi:hypothetical protein
MLAFLQKKSQKLEKNKEGRYQYWQSTKFHAGKFFIKRGSGINY